MHRDTDVAHRPLAGDTRCIASGMVPLLPFPEGTMTTMARPEVAARIRQVTRLLAFGDPRASSDLPPFMRARRFLEHLCTLDASGWQIVMQREPEDSEARDQAEALLLGVFDALLARVACDAIVAETRRVVRRAVDRRCVPEEMLLRASRLAVNASLALVMREMIPEYDFRLLYGTFVDMRTMQ